jgi:hypothetical protein
MRRSCGLWMTAVPGANSDIAAAPAAVADNAEQFARYGVQ